MSIHKSVLKGEVLALLRGCQSLYDGTLGLGGHSRAFLDENEGAKLFATDQDEEALNLAKTLLPEASLALANFKDCFNIWPKLNVEGMLLDLGISSLQLDKDERGFSTKSSELDMRMNKELDMDAKQVVNTYSKQELERVLREYGELKNARDIAELIIKARGVARIEKARELSMLFNRAKLRGRHVELATVVFQAIRMEVNKELEVLRSFLSELEARVRAGQLRPILVVISFHSLEDRIVKGYFKKWASACGCEDLALRCTCSRGNKIGEVLTKKPVEASLEELRDNSRARSARLRAFRFLGPCR